MDINTEEFMCNFHEIILSFEKDEVKELTEAEAIKLVQPPIISPPEFDFSIDKTPDLSSFI